MSTFAAVMTGSEAGAIATIQLCGDAAEDVLRAVFRRADGRPLISAAGRILLGDIVDAGQIIDHITVGCEGPGSFAIHCHGNPLIVERIMGLLQRRGVQPVRAEQLLAQGGKDSIATEAKLALATVKTIEGASLIVNQVEAGLAATARRWLAELDSVSLERIAAQARQVLKDSEIARLILSGCTIALVGPPNSGKSTLLNALAGREKAIVTDIPGTTRDWVSAEIHIPPLAATVIDTAGLDSTLAKAGNIDRAAQHKSLEALNRADLIVLVLDANHPADQLPGAVAELLVDRKAITVLNKADLPHRLDPKFLPTHLQKAVRISAKLETGIEDLVRAIHEACDLTNFSLSTPAAFTDRQRVFVERLAVACHLHEASACIAGLLRGPLT